MKNELEKWFNDYTDIILGDLTELEKIQKPNKYLCTVPTAMLIFSALDFIGYLLREKGERVATDDNLKEAFQYKDKGKGFFKSKDSSYTVNTINKLVKQYRHGLMHTFLPSNDSSKYYGLHKDDGTMLFEQKTQNGIPVESLNVNILASHFKGFIEFLKKKIAVANDNSKIIINMNKAVRITTSSSASHMTTIAPHDVNQNKEPKSSR